MHCPTLPEKFTLSRLSVGMLLTVMAVTSGCTAAKFAGKATVATVSVSTDVACVTVRSTGKVASTATEVSFDIASIGVKAASKFSRPGAVVFIDPLTGVVAQLPWQKNLTLLGASQLAGLGGATHVVRLIRAGQAIKATHRDVLAAGDVIELAPRRRA